MRIEVNGDRKLSDVLDVNCASYYPTDECFYEVTEEAKNPKTNITFSVISDNNTPIAKATAYLERGKADITIKGMNFPTSASIGEKRALFKAVCDTIFDETIMGCPILIIHAVDVQNLAKLKLTEQGDEQALAELVRLNNQGANDLLTVAEQLGFVGPILHGSPVLRLLNPNYYHLVATRCSNSNEKQRLKEMRKSHQRRVDGNINSINILLGYAQTVGRDDLAKSYELILENLNPHDNKTKQGTK